MPLLALLRIRFAPGIAAWLMLCAMSFAAEPPKPAKAKPTVPAPAARPTMPPYECRWATGPITVDGRADEPAWSGAQPIDAAAFSVPWIKNGSQTAPSATRAKLLWDNQNLYFYAEMEDGDLFADIVEHDGPTYLNDVFELFFKPDATKPGYYEFEVNAAGTKFDMFVPERNFPKFDDFLTKDPFTWQTAVARRGTLNRHDDRDAGWSVEGRIPWVDMIHTGARPLPDEVWHYALCRYDYDQRWARPSLSTTAPLSRADFHLYEDYAPIRFVASSEPPRPFGLEQRVLLTTSQVVGSPDPPPPYRAVRAYPNLRLNHLLMLKREPGTRQMWGLAQLSGVRGTSVIRFADHPAVTEYETLHVFDGTAYDLTFHPRFAENGQVFFGWSCTDEESYDLKVCRVSRLTVDVKSPLRPLVPDSQRRILQWESDGHNGCAVEFGNDGMFYVTTGDGTSDSDTNIAGQDMTKLLSKLLRIDVDHVRPEDAAAGRAYSVPSDNPFVDLPGARPETWAYGFRNPWRMAVDRATGHIWVTQNGQDLYEQVYLVRRGENYGWSVTEGGHPFYPERKRGPTPIVPPTVEHSHMEARSLTGGVVYHGQKYPELRGAYLYGDYSTGKIWMVRHDGKQVVEHREIADTTFGISAFALDADGEILVCDYRPNNESAAYYLEPTPPVTQPKKFPRRLTESGLFEAAGGHRVLPGVIPYTVNSPLWSDGTYKERFIAVPGEGKIDFHPQRSWNFPDGTVLIKSFAWETKANDPASRRWIETRFLLKQQNEWIGYSYAWNDEQTDAELVESNGRDREFTLADPNSPGGVRRQTWHYPSRAECMICHSRAANFVLGLSTPQMNCEQDYRGVRDNQLRALSHIGMFSRPPTVDWRELTVRAVRKAGMNTEEAALYWRGILATKGQRRAAGVPNAETDPQSFERLVDPADETAPLEARARSYLHANCAHCHTQAGGGNAQIQLGFAHSLFEMKVLDERPLHANFSLPDARIVAPSDPKRSTLWHRMAISERGRMPPIAVAIPDRLGVDLIGRWIASLPKHRPPTRVAYEHPAPTRVLPEE